MINTDKVKKYALLLLPYVFLFWLFNKFAEAVRIAPGRDILQKLMYGIGSLNITMSRPLPSFNPQDMLAGIAGAAVVYGIIQYKTHNAKKWRKDVEYGSARWGNRKDIEPFIDPKPDKNIILTASESLSMNNRPSNPKYARNKNVMVVGGSGSGKTRFWLKPNLMQMHSSYVITDPKGLL